jgi:acetyl-CoA C-acetyltransferase
MVAPTPQRPQLQTSNFAIRHNTRLALQQRRPHGGAHHEEFVDVTTDSVVIAAAQRTPTGSFQGALSPLSAPQLGSAAIKASLEKAGLDGTRVNEVLMGCVLPAGLGQAPARQAALGAGLPLSVPCTTVNKVCGSGMKTVMLAHDTIQSGNGNVIVAGGMESMSNAPYLLPKARGGYRMGHQQTLDHMFFDGLQSPFDGNMMGHFAEQTATKYAFTRQQQDNFATQSVHRAVSAVETDLFQSEVTPVTVKHRRKEVLVEHDEEPYNCDIDKIPTLRPAFAADGTVTAASSSGIADGAAALLVMRESAAKENGVQPLARILGHTSHAHEPEWFTTANVGSIQKLHEKLGFGVGDVDLYEINEAFACVTMATMHDLDIPHSKVNINGGACALGHPIGASGARILVTLIHALKQRNERLGIAAICIGGGESTALAVEII